MHRLKAAITHWLNVWQEEEEPEKSPEELEEEEDRKIAEKWKVAVEDIEKLIHEPECDDDDDYENGLKEYLEAEKAATNLYVIVVEEAEKQEKRKKIIERFDRTKSTVMAKLRLSIANGFYVMRNWKAFWSELRSPSYKPRAFTELARKLYTQVYECFGEEDRSIPMEIRVIFEAMNVDSRNRLLPGVNVHEDYRKFSEIRKLEDLMVTCEQLTSSIQAFYGIMKDPLREYGFVDASSLEYALVLQNFHEIILLHDRLEAAGSIVGRDVICHVQRTDKNLLDAIKIKYSSNSELYQNLLHHGSNPELSVSVFQEIEEAIGVCFTVLYRVILIMTHYYSLPPTQVGYVLHSRLVSKVNDLKLIVRTATRNLDNNLDMYRDMIEQQNQHIGNDVESEEFEPPNYSRENQIKRCCGVNIKLAQELLTTLVECEKDSLELVEQSNSNVPGDTYKFAVEKLHQKELEAEEKAVELLSQMNRGSAITRYIISKLQKKTENNEEDEVVEPEIGHAPIVEEEQESEILDRLEQFAKRQVEYLIDEDTDIDCDPSSVDKQDEVFLRIQEDVDSNDLRDAQEGGSDLDEKKLHKQLYTGVITQLQTALVPVKEKTRQREKEALWKTAGVVPLNYSEHFEQEEEDNEVSSYESNQNTVKFSSFLRHYPTTRPTATYEDETANEEFVADNETEEALDENLESSCIQSSANGGKSHMQISVPLMMTEFFTKLNSGGFNVESTEIGDED